MPRSTTLPDIVSNTGPLISLEKIGFAFIRALYRKIIVPRSVVSCHFSTPEEYLRRQGIENFIETAPDPVSHPLTLDLDAGERHAISLAKVKGLNLLIEEREGRRVAAKIGIHFSGIAGQITLAHRLGTLSHGKALSLYEGLYRSNRIHRDLYLMLVEGLNASRAVPG